MTLTRLSDQYGFGEDSVSFVMLDGPREVVCEISCETLTRLGRVMGLTEPSKIFETSRDRIERAASDKYDQTTRVPYEVLTVTADDLDLGDA
jgi:Protein of unknown function (DUF1488)